MHSDTEDYIPICFVSVETLPQLHERLCSNLTSTDNPMRSSKTTSRLLRDVSIGLNVLEQLALKGKCLIMVEDFKFPENPMTYEKSLPQGTKN